MSDYICMACGRPRTVHFDYSGIILCEMMTPEQLAVLDPKDQQQFTPYRYVNVYDVERKEWSSVYTPIESIRCYDKDYLELVLYEAQEKYELYSRKLWDAGFEVLVEDEFAKVFVVGGKP